MNLVSQTALNNQSIQDRLLKEIFQKREPIFSSFIHDKQAKCVFVVLYFGQGGDFLYSPDFYKKDDVYGYIETLYDELGAIPEQQAFTLERSIRRFSKWNELQLQ